MMEFSEYSEEMKKSVFKEWIQELLNKGKKSMKESGADICEVTFAIDDLADHTIEAVVKITIRTKGMEDDS